MIDTHAHLTFPAYADDLQDVLSRARESGINAIVNPGSDLKQSRAAVKLAKQEKDIFAAVGIHPQDVSSFSEDVFSELSELAGEEQTVAIGEVGLEKKKEDEDMKGQQDMLSQFVALGQKINKPLIFHVRNAHNEFIEFLKDITEPISGVVHCFSASWKEAEIYLDAGLYISVTGIVTYPNAEDLQEAVKNIPLERLMVETDSPFLAPQSKRGQRNEPACVEEIAEKIAALKNISLAEVEEITDKNANYFFGLDKKSGK